MDDVISPLQNGFVKGRSIADNIFLAFELMTYLHKAHRCKTRWCAFKFDIQKAYDSILWNFQDAILRIMNFPAHWVQIIMQCLTTISYTLLLNGQKFRDFFLNEALSREIQYYQLMFKYSLMYVT